MGISVDVVHTPTPFESARSELDLSAFRASLAQLPPDVQALLPRKGRPGAIRDSRDMTDLSRVLTRALIASDDSNAALICLESLFAHASIRLGWIKYSALLSRTASR